MWRYFVSFRFVPFPQYTTPTQLAVANAMETLASRMDAGTLDPIAQTSMTSRPMTGVSSTAEAWLPKVSHMLSLGDNFYSVGVTSVDDARWQQTFERVYSPLNHIGQLDWYALAGNHDYHGNVAAQVCVARCVAICCKTCSTMLCDVRKVTFAACYILCTLISLTSVTHDTCDCAHASHVRSNHLSNHALQVEYAFHVNREPLAMCYCAHTSQSFLIHKLQVEYAFYVNH
jgi:hypothetical protein